MMEQLNILLAPFEQLWKSPATMFVVLPIAIVAVLLEVWKRFPSDLVPWVCIVLGCVLYPNLVRVDTVPPQFPNPRLVLVLTGFLLGFCAVCCHKLLFKVILTKLWPAAIPLPAFLANTIQPEKNENERSNNESGK